MRKGPPLSNAQNENSDNKNLAFVEKGVGVFEASEDSGAWNGQIGFSVISREKTKVRP